MSNTTLPTMHYSKQLQQQQHRQLSSQPPGGGGMNLGNIFNNAKQQGNKKPGETLEQFGVDLTKLAQDGKLDPVIGRHEEIRRTLQILGKFYLYAYAFANGNICSLIYIYMFYITILQFDIMKYLYLTLCTHYLYTHTL